jgi:methylthioxylose transferase
VLLAVREVAGEARARAAWPFVAAAPLAIWIATSADALYAGVGAWAVTLVILATGRDDRRGDVLALGGGLLFGVLAFLSYGLVLLACIPLVVAWSRRRVRPLALAAIGASVVFAAFALAGFWWFAGLAATRARYHAGVASRRPYDVFLLVNAACLAIATGPAVAVALARARDRRLWALLGGALVAIGIATASGMSKGEVERIWLPFSLWLLPAGAVLATGRRASGWLALQLAFAIGVQTLVRSPW